MNNTGETNELLRKLQLDARVLFGDNSEVVRLNGTTTLLRAGEPTTHVHFIQGGLLSVISEAQGATVEVGLIGRDGLSGSWISLGQTSTPFRVVSQVEGQALRVPVNAFRQACTENLDLRAAVLGYAQSFTTMVAETCWAAARLSVEGRLARWLLMAHERLDGDEIVITHETLSNMLGVRRPGVTVVTHVLEGERMIRAKRGRIQILDREKLEAVARGCYRPAPDPSVFAGAETARAA